MKDLLSKNSWIIALALCFLFLVSYKAIEVGACIETDFKSFKVGICENEE